ncbi:MAG: ABC transporter ATP-binding protein [Ignavibacteriae bacterium]|nr:ABC transporter ATP-binding protein [Ignavibacteria bacterium]MBI3365862.1 ABC transporter ATP-binding protein [Ignavibacteriota bacterium]
MTSPILRCSNIHKHFTLDQKAQSGLHVLLGIDLRVNAGEIVSIVGASGSGKSTLLHILSGLDRPTEGEVYWQEKNIVTVSDDALARLRGSTVGFVFQFHHLLPEFTALENVMIPIMIHRGTKSEAERRAKELLSRVGVSKRLEHKPSELSGGEQQRVAVARALANNPKIVFADEPTGNLDSVSSRQLHELLWELNRLENQTFIIVTHNEQFAERSHRVFRMLDGKLHALDS